MYYIGIDVAKKALSVFDGKSNLEFENQTGLKPLYHYLKKHYRHWEDLGIIFEATGIYSDQLKEFCANQEVKAYILNPKQSYNFAKSLGVRSKTDKIDAPTLWRYQKLVPPEKMQVPVLDQEARFLLNQLSVYPRTAGSRIQSLRECYRPYP